MDFFASWIPAFRATAEGLASAAGRPDSAPQLLRSGGYDPATGALDPASLLACGTSAELASCWAPLLGLASASNLESQLNALFAKYGVTDSVPIGDLPGLFGRLRARGLAMGVATSDSTAGAGAILEHLGIIGLLDHVAGYDSGTGVKPDPQIVFAFCAAVGLEPRQVAVVGDSVVDLGMARAAGAGLAVGVLSGVSAREYLAPLADHVLDDIATLETVLGLADS